MVWTDAKVKSERDKARGRPLGNGRYRNFCSRCGVMMVVDTDDRKSPALTCYDCFVPVSRLLPYRAGGVYGPYKDDTSPGWENMVRLLEDVDNKKDPAYDDA